MNEATMELSDEMVTEEDIISASAGGRSVRLKVREVIVETADARSIVFDIPADSVERFAYAPGQFLTLRVPLADGTAVARCYSLSSTPDLDDAPRVTVKRIEDGRASSWLCESLEPGAELDVLPPTGQFTRKDLSRDLLLFAAGSGITPVFSILRDALHNGTSRVVLVYANRDENSIIFAQQLRDLTEQFGDRLVIFHVLESVQGRLTPAMIRTLSRALEVERSKAYICGPAPFMSVIEDELRAVGMPHEDIVIERFLSLSGDPFSEPEIDAAALADDAETVSLAVEIDGENHEDLKWPVGTKLLDFLLSSDIKAPFSCREGACSACACRITQGSVTMLANEVLEKEDLDEGWVLGCQSVPSGTEPIAVTYD